VPLSQLVASASHGPTLVVVYDGRVSAHRIADEGVVIGRGERASLRIDDVGLSRRHAQVRWVGGHGEILDLASSNGTFVDGARIAPNTAVAVGPESIISCGRTRLMVDADGPGLSTAGGPRATALATLRRVASTDLSVVISGERGTGKQRAARMVHGTSRRMAQPLRVVDVSAGRVEEHVESLSHLAPNDTVYLAHVERLDPLAQLAIAKPLAARPSIRVIASVTLDESVPHAEEAAFYDRIAQVRVRLPPVRVLGPELRDVVQDVVAAVVQRLGLSGVPEVTHDIVSAVASRRWPGNISELSRALERAVVLGDGDRLHAPALDEDDQGSWTPAEQEERRSILAALASCAGNQTRAAKALGWSRGTLVSRLAKYGIKRPRK